MPSHWFDWTLSRHCPEVKGEFRFSQKYLRPRQEQQSAPGGQYGPVSYTHLTLPTKLEV